MATAGPPPVKVSRSAYRRILYRRQFYPVLLRIVADGIRARRSRGERTFVLMIGIGDLVNLFPSLAEPARSGPVDVGTGGYPYRALVEAAPHVARTYSPFVYKPRRAAHRRLITAALTPFYRRVILLDGVDAAWWTRGTHIGETCARRCACAAPTRGAIWIPDEHRAHAAAYVERHRLGSFTYVAQVIRRNRPFRSWPLSHYHALYERLRVHGAGRIVVDTTGSDETSVPPFCHHLDRLDLLTAAGVIEAARLFIGPDSGLTHVAAALGVRTISIHLGFPPESCRALGDNVTVVRERHAFDDPALTRTDEVFDAVAEYAGCLA